MAIKRLCEIRRNAKKIAWSVVTVCYSQRVPTAFFIYLEIVFQRSKVNAKKTTVRKSPGREHIVINAFIDKCKLKFNRANVLRYNCVLLRIIIKKKNHKTGFCTLLNETSIGGKLFVFYELQSKFNRIIRRDVWLRAIETLIEFPRKLLRINK